MLISKEIDLTIESWINYTTNRIKFLQTFKEGMHMKKVTVRTTTRTKTIPKVKKVVNKNIPSTKPPTKTTKTVTRSTIQSLDGWIKKNILSFLTYIVIILISLILIIFGFYEIMPKIKIWITSDTSTTDKNVTTANTKTIAETIPKILVTEPKSESKTNSFISVKEISKIPKTVITSTSKIQVIVNGGINNMQFYQYSIEETNRGMVGENKSKPRITPEKPDFEENIISNNIKPESGVELTVNKEVFPGNGTRFHCPLGFDSRGSIYTDKSLFEYWFNHRTREQPNWVVPDPEQKKLIPCESYWIKLKAKKFDGKGSVRVEFKLIPNQD